MHYEYKTRGVCSTKIDFDVEDGFVKNVLFERGCDGNLKAISKLIDGMLVDEVIEKLEGTTCGMKSTSCSDQLCKALRECR